MNTSCVECDGAIDVPADAIVGEIVSCRDCGTEYEVATIGSGAPTLKAADKVEEDWGE